MDSVITDENMPRIVQTAHNRSADDITDDLLIGARAIAAFLRSGITERQVYQMADAGAVPIRRVPGMGLQACKSTLNRFFRDMDKPFIKALDDPPTTA